EKRQVIIGDGKTVIIPGQGEFPICEINIPLKEQPPCLFLPIPGPITPSTKEKRGAVIGDPTTVLIPGVGQVPVCFLDKPLKEQLPCILPPIVGPIVPSTKNKRQFVIGDPSNGGGIIIPGQPELPPCAVDIPLNEQPPCFLPPISGPINPPGGEGGSIIPGHAKRQFVIGDPSNGGGIIIPGQPELPPCAVDIPLNEQPPCFLPPISGPINPPGGGGSIVPGHQKRDGQVSLDAVGTYAAQCPDLAGANIALQTLIIGGSPSPAQQIVIDQLIAFLQGCGLTVTPTTGGGYTVIKPADKRDVSGKVNIEPLKKAYFILFEATTKIEPSFTNWLILHHLRDVIVLYEPSTTLTVATKAKRQLVNPPSGECNPLDVLALRGALAVLLTAYPDPASTPINILLIQQSMVAALKMCGVEVPGWADGIPTPTVTAGPIVPDPVVTGGPIVPDPVVSGGPIVPNPVVSGGPIVPDPVVSGGPIVPDPVISGGPIVPDLPATSTSSSVDPVVTGPIILDPITGPIVPDPVVTGAPLVPETPSNPGSDEAEEEVEEPTEPVEEPTEPVEEPTEPVEEGEEEVETPASRMIKRADAAPAVDTAALLAALKTLEEAYGSYGSGTIPTPIYLVMLNIVTILQTGGVVVPGWPPVLGPPTTVIGPST
ncbi:hypothetical protein VTJ04DRAFT_4380, partial [Mycothermus thermophilus]|uniref:uncharacterized protein n=1 Tax=Humicola insolens TaxID=85995 RepID=UPI003741F87C